MNKEKPSPIATDLTKKPQKPTTSKRLGSSSANSGSKKPSRRKSASSKSEEKPTNGKWSKPKNTQPLPKFKGKGKFAGKSKGPNKALTKKSDGSSRERSKPSLSLTLKGSFKLDAQQNLYFYPSSDNPTLSVEEEKFLNRRVQVAGKDSLTAIHGDEVIAIITPSGRDQHRGNYRGKNNSVATLNTNNWLEDPRNLKAKVTKVLERTVNRILGTYIYHNNKHYIAPEAQYLPEMEITHLGGLKPQIDDWISVRIEKWEKFYDKPILSLKNIIKYENPIELEELKVLARLGIEPEFNSAIQAELALITKQPLITDQERAKRDDFTRTPIKCNINLGM